MQVSPRHIAYIGLGANLGDAAGTVTAAIAQLAQLPETSIIRASALYRSAPVDATGDDFVNAVACIATSLPAADLLHGLQHIENLHGRVRPFVNAPRTLDCDLLLYDQVRINTPSLTVPHPRMHLRAFVLLPLLAIAPDCVIPGIGDASQCLAGVAGQHVWPL